MDPLAGLLDGLRANGAFVLRTAWDPPWALRILDEAPLALLAVARGEVWLVADDRAPVALRAGDIAIARGPDPYTVADAPTTEPQVSILPGQVCQDEHGQIVEEAWSLGVRSWGNAARGETVLLVGAYGSTGEIGDRLLRTLPPSVVLTADEWDCPLIPVLRDEAVKDHPGQAAVLDRLVDLIVIAALRTWFDRPMSTPPAWYRAQADPVVGPALRLLQNHPAEPWTVSGLASAVGASRAVLARRFTELVGDPPMTFLAHWRIDVAADLLRRSDATIGAIAQQVGYSTPFALSAAFKRLRGQSPQQYRDAVRPEAAPAARSDTGDGA